MASVPSSGRWGCLSLLGQAHGKRFALPLWAEIHPDDSPDSRATRLVNVAAEIGLRWRLPLFLALDAFFAVGPVCSMRGRRTSCPPRRWPTAKQETVRYLVLDLIWKPVKGLVRFILIETSRGRIILMSSDLTLEPLLALSLYTGRVRIESLFASVKNLLCGLAYHFWSKYLAPVSRRPRRGSHPAPVSSRPDRTANTLAAIQKFMALHLIVLGALQLVAATFGHAVCEQARCWLRTPSGTVPSDFVSRTALANPLHTNIRVPAKNPIIAIIRRRQFAPEKTAGEDVARERRAA